MMRASIEQGTRTEPTARWRRMLNVVRPLTTPLGPDDYLALLDSRWLEREFVGTVDRVIRETPTASTLVLHPSGTWPGHLPGQYLRLGVEVDGVRHWRAYSITSDPMHPAGEVSITVQRVDDGIVSRYLTERCAPGDRLVLGTVEGTFTLPESAASALLMITGGCGITPVMSMLRELERRDGLGDVVHLHASQTAEGFIFGAMLRALDAADNGYRLVERHSADDGRLRPESLDALVPDWRERTTYLSGPAAMMADFRVHWDRHGSPELLVTEDFQPVIGDGGQATSGTGGTIDFGVSGLQATALPGQSILSAGEAAGARLPHGCRMGICHSCIGRLREGQVRDLRTGDVHGEPGQAVRTCVNGPAGDIAIEL